MRVLGLLRALGLGLLVVVSSLPASADELKYLKELADVSPDLKDRIAQGNLRGQERAIYNELIWKFRIRVASRHQTDGTLDDTEIALLTNEEKLHSAVNGLKAAANDIELQKDLVYCGLLEGEPGNLPSAAVGQALRDFRQWKRTDTFGAPADEERAEIARIAGDVRKYFDFKEVKANDGRLGGNLLIPSGLISTVPDVDGAEASWRTYSSPNGKEIRVHNPVHPTQANTALSLAGTMLPDEKEGREVWRNFYFNEITSDDFLIETTTSDKNLSTGQTRVYVNNAVGWARGRNILGLKLTSNLSPLPAIARTAPVLPDPTSDGVTGEEQTRRNWERLMKTAWNAMVDGYKKLNGWKRADVPADCVSKTDKDAGGRWVAVVYATNRKVHEKYLGLQPGAPTRIESSEYFTSDPDPALHFGCARVWVPDKHKFEYDILSHIGRGPVGEAGNKPAEHFDFKAEKVLHDFEVTSDSDADLADPLLKKWTKAMLFIHGYNNTFADALYRVAQMATAANFKGRVYLFSWPARDSQFSYLPSIDRAEQSEADLRYFLKMILAGSKSLELDVIAHSMGSQILLRALDRRFAAFDRREGDDRTDRVRFRHIIFASPDVNNLVFRRKLPELIKFSSSVSVFASGCDGAIALSKLGRGNNARAGGLEGKWPIDLGYYGLDAQVVDVTQVSGGDWCWRNIGSYIGSNHSAFAFEKPILEQISSILSTLGRRKIKAPPDRLDKPASGARFAQCQYPGENGKGHGQYWVLTDDAGLAKTKETPAACPFKPAAGTAN